MKQITKCYDKVDLKKVVVIMAAICMMVTILPMVDADGTDNDLQNAINNTTDGVLNLNDNYTISAPITIDKSITINGNSKAITYTGNECALKITAGDSITLNNVTIDAKQTGAYGIRVTSASDITIKNSTICADNRGINIYPDQQCSGKTIEIDNSRIYNSRITDLDNETTYGDTRGISIYHVIDSDINILNGSEIKGFGYSVNTSNDLVDGVRAGHNTYTVKNSNITGWSAFNVWTVKNTFNITNSTLKGISTLDSDYNNFATFVINNGIYNGNSDNKNVVNIKGGSVEAYASGSARHADFLDDANKISEFNFSKYLLFQKVQLKFPIDSGTFMVSFPGSEVNINGMNNTTASYT